MSIVISHGKRETEREREKEREQRQTEMAIVDKKINR